MRCDMLKNEQRVEKSPKQAKTPVYALVGNPNSGKTTLFNALTGLRQKVGNYPGVTVERKEGTCFSQHGVPIKLIDLPGSYSLTARSPDEAIMQDVLLGRRTDTASPDRIVCIIDASNLERNLFFATQVVETGMPVILVLNMMDMAAKRGLKIDPLKLERLLGVTVVCCEAHKGRGLIDLKIAMSRTDLPVSPIQCPVPALFEKALTVVSEKLTETESIVEGRATAEAFLLLTEGAAMAVPGSRPIDPSSLELASAWHNRMDRRIPGWHSELIATRYAHIGDICRDVIRRTDPEGGSSTEKIDSIALHPVWGFFVLAGVMGALFYSIFSLAVPPMGWIDAGFNRLGGLVEAAMPAGDLRGLLVDGVIPGVGGVLVFLPQILLLFFFIGLLESTGYMARAAFILDRLMSRVGLHGKSFIPLLSSFACAIPGVMATRTIESPKDRLVTILIIPFMTCSARLPVYLLLIATLVPDGSMPALQKAGVLLIFYTMGTVGAFFFAWLFRRTLMRGVSPNVVMELPQYRMPSLKQVVFQMLDRGKIFVRRAGTIILGLSILLWFLMAYPKSQSEIPGDQLRNSFAGKIGRAVEPVFEPLGYDWKIDIGVLASFAAREVFVSTMAIIYNVDDLEDADNKPLVAVLQAQTKPDGTPRFTLMTCLSLMVFYVFALQCLSTVVIVRRETNSWFWPVFQMVYMAITAYIAAWAVFQGGLLLGFA